MGSKLTALLIPWCKRLSDVSLAALGKHCSCLEALDVRGAQQGLTDAGKPLSLLSHMQAGTSSSHSCSPFLPQVLHRSWRGAEDRFGLWS